MHVCVVKMDRRAVAVPAHTLSSCPCLTVPGRMGGAERGRGKPSGSGQPGASSCVRGGRRRLRCGQRASRGGWGYQSRSVLPGLQGGTGTAFRHRPGQPEERRTGLHFQLSCFILNRGQAAVAYAPWRQAEKARVHRHTCPTLYPHLSNFLPARRPGDGLAPGGLHHEGNVCG